MPDVIKCTPATRQKYQLDLVVIQAIILMLPQNDYQSQKLTDFTNTKIGLFTMSCSDSVFYSIN